MKPSRIVGYIASVFYPFCLVFGLYVVTHGHLTPGGGFQGGAVIATGAAMMIAAGRFRDEELQQKHGRYKWCETLGLLLFIVLAFGGLFADGTFFYNWLSNAGGWFGDATATGPNGGNLNTGGTIPLMNLAVGIEVLGGLSLILITMIRAMKENLDE